MLTLRDYQADTLDRIRSAEARGIRRQLVVAATGLGKTVMFTGLALERGGRTLILAHRDELIGQAVAKVVEVNPSLGLTSAAAQAVSAMGRTDLVLRPPTNGGTVGIVKAGANDVHATVVVASVQTLARSARLAQLTAPWEGTSLLMARDRFGLVVTDEAHHARAKSYLAVYDALGIGQPDGPLHVGFTATPDRGDGLGLSAVFDEVVAAHDMLWGIRSGYLSDLRGLLLELDAFDEDDLKTKRGDYDQGQAGRMLEDANAAGHVAAAWLEHAADRKTLAFWPTVASAQESADTFTRAGVTAACVSGSTPPEERQATLAAFHRGEIQVLSNCAVLTEGYDEPAVDCVIIARPTKSRALYTQMVGRGTRRHPAKADCLVLDVVGASSEHSLVTVPSLFGVEKAHRERKAGATMSELVAEHEAQEVLAGRLRAEEVALFAALRSEGIAWVPVHAPGDALQRFVRPLPDRKPTVVLAQRSADTWTSGLLYADGAKSVLIAEVGMELAQGIAEDYVRKHGGHLGTADAKWRKGPPSKKAKGYARSLGITIDPAWTAGDLSDAIDRAKARRKA